MALVRSMSTPTSLPTLIFSDSKPRSTAAIESATILSMESTLMVMSVVIAGSPPPSIRYSGALYNWPQRSCTAISIAALALVFFSIAPWMRWVMRLRLAISWPISRGAM